MGVKLSFILMAICTITGITFAQSETRHHQSLRGSTLLPTSKLAIAEITKDDNGRTLRLAILLNGQDDYVMTLGLDDSIYSPNAIVEVDETSAIGQRRRLSIDQPRKSYKFVRNHVWASLTVLSDDDVSPIQISGIIMDDKLGGVHEIFPVTRDESTIDHTIRRLSTTDEEFNDLVIEAPDVNEETRERKRQARNKFKDSLTSNQQEEEYDLSTAADSNNIFFPGCFPGDISALTVQISILTDAGFMDRLTSTLPGPLSSSDKVMAVQKEVERLIGIVRPLYLSQLNVQLQIQQLVIGTSSSPATILSRSRLAGSICQDPLGTLSTLTNWVRTMPNSAHWHLITDCFPSGTIGAAYIGTLCSKFGSNVGLSSVTNSLWLTLAHEIGHGFGAQHTFFMGLGGIMDYGSGRLNGGEVQFHPNNRVEMCSEITDAINSQCPFTTIASPSSLCGNGVLEPNEQCECKVGNGIKSCVGCSSCTLTQPTTRCSISTDQYVVRQPLTPAFVNVGDVSLVAHADCCKGNQLIGQSCNNGRDVCSGTGTCNKACATFFLTPCGFDESGCIQRCFADNKCQGIELKTLGPPPIPAGAVPDGLLCKMSDKSNGFCKRGVCIASTFAPTTSSVDNMQTDTPTTNQITLQPTSPPTNQPTPQPTQPTATLTPTSTLSPTLPDCPPNKNLLKCNPATKVRNAKSCASLGCYWCPVEQKCQAAPLACGIATLKGLEAFYGHCPAFTRNNKLGRKKSRSSG